MRWISFWVSGAAVAWVSVRFLNELIDVAVIELAVIALSRPASILVPNITPRAHEINGCERDAAMRSAYSPASGLAAGPRGGCSSIAIRAMSAMPKKMAAAM